MPANTVRGCASPMSSVSFNSFSAPSTCSALTIFATRRSTLLKSSMEMVSATDEIPPAPPLLQRGGSVCYLHTCITPLRRRGAEGDLVLLRLGVALLRMRLGHGLQAFLVGGDHRRDQLGVEAGREMFVFIDEVPGWQGVKRIFPCKRRSIQKDFHIMSQLG